MNNYEYSLLRTEILELMESTIDSPSDWENYHGIVGWTSRLKLIQHLAVRSVASIEDMQSIFALLRLEWGTKELFATRFYLWKRE